MTAEAKFVKIEENKLVLFATSMIYLPRERA
jgi:hypothetical protein